MSVRLPITLALAALAFAFPVSAEAMGANVVPNPGFEQPGCGSPSSVCDWSPAPSYGNFMSLDVDLYWSGSASLDLWWQGQTGSELPVAKASTDPAFCATIGPGEHAASFWYTSAPGNHVALGATFYQGPSCTGTSSDSSLTDSPRGVDWQPVTGVLVAPPGTQSAAFSLSVSSDDCFAYSGCSFGATFDDLVVEDAVLGAPAITSFTPTSGPDGTRLDILGMNFTGASSVTVGGVSASFSVLSDTEIQATVPTGATTGPISVTTANGSGASSESFGVIPTINSLSPTCGVAGTSVDIRGSGFTGATNVQFNGIEFDAIFTVVTDAEIRAVVPAAATAGPISVTTPTARTVSGAWFQGACGSTAPWINVFSPYSGGPGTPVRIVGGHFTGATSVTFGGKAAAFTLDSDTSILAIVPSGASSGPISVTSPKGTGTSSTSFIVTADTSPPDTTPPETTITSGPPSTTTSSSATFQFSASDPATFQCSLDAGAFAACGSPATYTGLVAGSHTFRVQATDTAGNTDPTPAQQTWTVNTPPTAQFAFSCTGLTCHFDGSGSADSDGTIISYGWDFGDGTTTSTSGVKPDHTYAHAAGYTVTLTVTDNAGATATQSETVTPISLTARGWELKGLERVDLSWTGPAGASFDVSRNGSRIPAAVQATSYTDNLNTKGSGTYTYKVCAAAFASCSDPVTVSFSAGAVTSRAAGLARDSRGHRGRRHHKPIHSAHTGRKRS